MLWTQVYPLGQLSVLGNLKNESNGRTRTYVTSCLVRDRPYTTSSLIARSRPYTTSSSSSNGDKIVASVLFERLSVVVPKIDPIVYAFQEYSFRWRQQYRRQYPDEFLKKSDSRGKGDYQIEYVPAPRITEADKTNDKKSLQRALDRRLYLLLFGTPFGAPDGKPTWHFLVKMYESEEKLRKFAESALEFVIGDLSHTYFVGNAPMGHMMIQPTENVRDLPSIKICRGTAVMLVSPTDGTDEISNPFNQLDGA